VRSIVEGFAEGRIKLPKAKERNGNQSGAARVAPSFITTQSISGHREMLYSAASLAKFIGNAKLPNAA
jgi:hypothetical protein